MCRHSMSVSHRFLRRITKDARRARGGDPTCYMRELCTHNMLRGRYQPLKEAQDHTMYPSAFCERTTHGQVTP